MRFRNLLILSILAICLIFHEGCRTRHSSDAVIPGNTEGFSAPAAVVAVAGDGKVTLSWRGVDGADSYKLYTASQSGVRKDNFSGLTDGASDSNVVSPYTLAGLSNNKTYYFIVTAINASGEESAESHEMSSTPESGMPGPVTISGTIRYEDREYGKSGFTGRTGFFKPVRFADVELADSSGRALDSGSTDSNGTYTFSVSSGSAPVYVRVISSMSFGSSTDIEVKNLDRSLYSFAGALFTPSGKSDVSISVPASGSSGGAFNIMDVYTNGFQFMRSLGLYPPPLKAFWRKGNEQGTYYCFSGCSPGSGIYVLGGDAYGDADEFDDDVLLHEFGHFIADKFSRDDSPGGNHSLGDNDQDLRLSWSEGWGNFFATAVKKWLSETDAARLSTSGLSPSEYIDTVDNDWQLHFNFGSPGGEPYYYASSEVAVANVLIKMLDFFGMQPILDVVQSNLFMDAHPDMTPVNIELFWDGWLQSNGDSASLRSIFENRMIRYREENHSSLASAITYTTPREYTLYPGDAAHYVSFTAGVARRYTITTSSLKNGADTSLELFDGGGSTRLDFNDNKGSPPWQPYVAPFNCDAMEVCHENGNDSLASTVSAELSAGTYYVRISSTAYPAKPLSAGKYGTYTFTITSQ